MHCRFDCVEHFIFCNPCVFLAQRNFVGTMGGELKPMDYESETDEEEIDDEENKEGNTTSSRYSNLGQKLRNVLLLVLIITTFKDL